MTCTLAWPPRNKDILESDHAILPLGHNGRLKDNLDARGLGQVIAHPPGQRFLDLVSTYTLKQWKDYPHTLGKDGVDGQNQEGEECGCSHYYPYDMT